MDAPIHVILGGGATGGHVIPALNLGREIKRRISNAKLTYIGAKDSLEERLADADDIPFKRVKTAFLRRSASLKNVIVPFIAVFSVIQASLILIRERASLVISTGGYSAWPSAAAARFTGRPYVLFEGNAYPGLVTRMLSGKARRVYLASQDAAKHVKADPNRILVTGNPVLFDNPTGNKADARCELGLQSDRFTILATGGSGGAGSINKAMFDAKCQLLDHGYNLIWQVGKQWNGDIEVPGEYSDRLIIERFLNRQRMSTAMMAADMAVTRCGAMTLGELAAFGLPAALIPYPASTGGHQEANGREYANAGAGILILDKDLSDEMLLDTIEDMNNPDTLKAMSDAMRRMNRPEAITIIVDDIMGILGC